MTSQNQPGQRGTSQNATRQRLVAGTMATIREHGIGAVSARTVAAVAGVNQALVFYHFGSVRELVVAAFRDEAARQIAGHRAALAEVTSLGALVAFAATLRGESPALTPLLAAAHTDPLLAEAAKAALAEWIAEIEAVLTRILAASVLDGLADPADLARAVAAAFLGAELLGGVDPRAEESAFAVIGHLAALAQALDGQSPVVRRALKAAIKRTR